MARFSARHPQKKIALIPASLPSWLGYPVENLRDARQGSLQLWRILQIGLHLLTSRAWALTKVLDASRTLFKINRGGSGNSQTQ